MFYIGEECFLKNEDTVLTICMLPGFGDFEKRDDAHEKAKELNGDPENKSRGRFVVMELPDLQI